MWHVHDSGDWFSMAPVMVLFWVPLALLVFWGIAQLGPSRRRPPVDRPFEDPRETARHAYASGAIDREQFQQIIADLNDSSADGAEQ